MSVDLSTMVKIMALVLLGLTYLAALVVAVAVYFTYGLNATLPSGVAVVLGTGLGMALNILGIHQGASLTQATKGTDNASTTAP